MTIGRKPWLRPGTLSRAKLHDWEQIRGKAGRLMPVGGRHFTGGDAFSTS